MNVEHPQMHGQYIAGPKQRHFSPYAFNGGTVLAIAGEDFAVIASDTRLSEGFSIHTRDNPKLYKLDTSMQYFPPERSAFCHRAIKTKGNEVEDLTMYKNDHHKEMSCPAIAAMISTILYYRRFFPYYVYNIVAGLDTEGKGCVYSYDPVGSYERESYRSAGSASAMLQPLLDNQIGFKNQEGVEQVALSRDKAVNLAKDVFISAAERDIYTGDSIIINVIDKNGITSDSFPLRRD
ncbi:proteasome subunit beta type-1-B-like [Saccoglossus kowalevskii]|uniref:Proteasome subunit beta type-1-B-like n=1 Tax=Saccoglossus kowalevskii TaxID=10224 RepID=A0ABM0GR33_SACKO|nr:PREDICTED: proteasome subunit beta type-1-B-like [Saccoglossus kowalevskii]